MCCAENRVGMMKNCSVRSTYACSLLERIITIAEIWSTTWYPGTLFCPLDSAGRLRLSKQWAYYVECKGKNPVPQRAAHK
jgi:hypothetical protein